MQRAGLMAALPPARRTLRAGLALAATLAAAAGGRAADRPAAPVPVLTAPVTQGDVAVILKGIGTVQALNAATIRSQVTGILEGIDFSEGQAVRKGDVLARIDPRVYRARLEQARAQLGRDQAQLANTQKNLARTEPLLQKGFATDQQAADQEAQVDQLQSTLKSDQAAIDDAAAQLDFATLRAPFDGVVGLRLVDVGNLIRPTDTTGIVVVTQVQPISVVFTLPTADIPAVQAALGRGPVPVAIFDQAGTRQLDSGTLLLINNQADAASGTVQLKANMPNAQRQLWPGTFVNAQVTTSVARNALTVPTDAIQQGAQGQFVFVVGPDKTVRVQAVEVAQRVAGVALVTAGLQAGETVVTQGQYRLTPGTAVVASAPADVPKEDTASAGLLP